MGEVHREMGLERKQYAKLPRTSLEAMAVFETVPEHRYRAEKVALESNPIMALLWIAICSARMFYEVARQGSVSIPESQKSSRHARAPSSRRRPVSAWTVSGPTRACHRNRVPRKVEESSEASSRRTLRPNLRARTRSSRETSAFDREGTFTTGHLREWVNSNTHS